MNDIRHMILAAVSCALLLSSCAVKEDRSSCPCLLVLDFSGTDTSVVNMAEVVVMEEPDILSADTVEVSRLGGFYRTSVPRRSLHLKVWSGTDSLSSDGILTIPLGRDCPPVYMHDSDILPQNERYDKVVRMRRNHCRLKIQIEGSHEFSYGLRLEGNVAGYDSHGDPMTGEFSYVVPYDEFRMEYLAVLPRQSDASLMLYIDDGDTSVKAFALGQYIVSGGYDWTADDLEDISVSIDFAQTEVLVTVDGWESVYDYDVEL